MCSFKLKMYTKTVFGQALPQTPLGKLTEYDAPLDLLNGWGGAPPHSPPLRRLCSVRFAGGVGRV